MYPCSTQRFENTDTLLLLLPAVGGQYIQLKEEERFAYLSKICVYAKFAYVSKSGHVNGALNMLKVAVTFKASKK